MKTVLLSAITFCVIAMPALGALTDADLDKIRLIVKEEVKSEIAVSETRMKERIIASETRMKESIAASETRMKESISEVKSEITVSETRMKEYINQQVDTLKTPVAWLIGILLALIAIIGLPLAILTVFLGWRSIKDNSQEKQIEGLTREVEMLKQHRSVNP